MTGNSLLLPLAGSSVRSRETTRPRTPAARNDSHLGDDVHELQIAESVVEMLNECRQGRAVSKVRLLIGRRWNVTVEALEFCFELATVGTPIEGAELDIEWRHGRDLSVAAVELV